MPEEPKFPPREGDLPAAQIVEMANEVIRKGGMCWILWTCPACGERARSEDANSFNTRGYVHTEKADGSPCGALYEGPLFGLTVGLIIAGEDPRDVAEKN